MSDLEATLEQARAMIGQQVAPPGEGVVERGFIRSYAEAVNDPNPLWVDEEYARSTGLGGIIAPPTLMNHVIRRPVDVTVNQRPRPPVTLPVGNAVNAGTEYEFREPLRPGDRIRSLTRLASVEEKHGRSGRMVLVITETTYTNQDDRVVAISRQSMIYR